MNVLAAETRIMELRAVLEARNLKAATPYHPSAWLLAPTKPHLILTYPHIPHSLQYGFIGSTPPMKNTYTPPNNPSIVKKKKKKKTFFPERTVFLKGKVNSKNNFLIEWDFVGL